jgi:DNA topoisomerase-1
MDNEFKTKNDESFFKYYGGNNIYTINSCHVNDFLKKYGDFSAKNFRTWTANEYFIKHLYYILSDTPDLNKLSERKTNMVINKAVDEVASNLNNTRAICKKSYINNDIIEDVKSNPVDFLNKIKEYRKKRLKNCTSLESILLKLLVEYRNN